MKINKVLLIVALLLFGAHNVFAQTATPTLTATPSATPTPVNVSINPLANITDFGYIGANIYRGTSANIYGGRVIRLKATAALSIGQVVKIDASNASQVVVATQQTAPHVLGVVIGKRTFTQDAIGSPPAAGNTAIIQINGIARMACDGSVTVGDSLIVSAAIVGGAADGNAAGTHNANAFGLALTACTTAGQNLDVLLEPSNTL